MKRDNIQKCRSLRKTQTEAEKNLWYVLRNRQLDGIKFRRQFPLGGFILDVYSPEHKLCIEADGGGHYEEEKLRQDVIRAGELAKSGVRVLRFSNEEILKNIEGVCEAILKAVTSNGPPHLSPLPQGERR